MVDLHETIERIVLWRRYRRNNLDNFAFFKTLTANIRLLLSNGLAWPKIECYLIGLTRKRQCGLQKLGTIFAEKLKISGISK